MSCFSKAAALSCRQGHKSYPAQLARKTESSTYKFLESYLPRQYKVAFIPELDYQSINGYDGRDPVHTAAAGSAGGTG